MKKPDKEKDCICSPYKEKRQMSGAVCSFLEYVGKLWLDKEKWITRGSEAYKCECGQYWSTFGFGSDLLTMIETDYVKECLQ